MSTNYFKKTSSYTVESYSVIYIRNSLKYFFFLINIFNILLIKKSIFILKSPLQFLKRKFVFYYHLFKNKNQVVVLDQNGFANFDINSIPLGKEILEKYKEIYRNTTDDNTQYILNGEKLWSDKKLIDFATSEQVLIPIAKYLGTAPVLHGVSMWRSKIGNKCGGTVGDFHGAPFFHMDALDT